MQASLLGNFNRRESKKVENGSTNAHLWAPMTHRAVMDNRIWEKTVGRRSLVIANKVKELRDFSCFPICMALVKAVPL